MKPDKIYLSLILLVLFTMVSWITSCTHNANIDSLPKVCFSDVRNIFSTSCAISGCHDGRGRESGRALNNYNNIVSMVVPGNPGSSRAYQVLISKWGENKMPPNQPLSLENRTTIRVWIEQGAQDSISTCASR